MPDAFKYLIDAAAAFGLFVALLLVLLVDWAFVSKRVEPIHNDLEGVTVFEDKTEGGPKRLRLAVTPTAKTQKFGGTEVELWDDMGKLLRDLGEGYRYEEITEDDILSKRKLLTDYDVLFLTCKGGGEELENDLRAFVDGGGILYASDWRYDAVAKAFPDMAVAGLRGDGDKQEVNADVVDSGLRERLGTQMKLKFDMPEWKPAAFGGPRVQVLLQGTYRRMRGAGGGLAKAPLMVKFRAGKGTVIFTSFHNEKQNSRTEKELLQYLVFSLVTAGLEADVTGQMEKGGFTPQRSNLLSSPATGQSTPPKTYENQRECTLRFALAFRNEGAVLRFHIKSPDGKQYTWEGQSTVVLEVANAQPGTWTYIVTAQQLPHQNFPFKVIVGEKK